MATGPEQRLSKRVRTWLNTKPQVYAVKVPGGIMRCGLPDWLIVGRQAPHCDGGGGPAIVLFIELKAGTADLSPLQKGVRAHLKRVGALYRVCRSLEEVQACCAEAGLIID